MKHFSYESGKFNHLLHSDFYGLACVGVWEMYCLLCRQDTQFSRENTFTGSAALCRRHTADSVQTLAMPTARLREVKTFGLIHYLVQSIKHALLLLAQLDRVRILSRKENKGKKKSCQHGQVCKDRKSQHLTLVIEDERDDRLWIFSPDWIYQTDYKARLRVLGGARGQTIPDKDG